MFILYIKIYFIENNSLKAQNLCLSCSEYHLQRQVTSKEAMRDHGHGMWTSQLKLTMY